MLLLVLFFGATALLGGCEDEVQQAPAPTAKGDAKKGAEKAPKEVSSAGAASDKEYTRPEYPGQVRRDPFVFEPPKRQVGEGDGSEDRVKEPLESFELSTLTLVGIVTGSAVPTAMFKDGTAFGHIAKEGDRIGRDGGRITDIRDNEVEVTINAKSSLSSDEELEGEGSDAEEESEPVTVVILLTNTEIPLSEEDEDDEGDGDDENDIVDELQNRDGAAEGPSSNQ
jgi:Tfp pilus assembly protein PilP